MAGKSKGRTAAGPDWSIRLGYYRHKRFVVSQSFIFLANLRDPRDFQALVVPHSVHPGASSRAHWRDRALLNPRFTTIWEPWKRYVMQKCEGGDGVLHRTVSAALHAVSRVFTMRGTTKKLRRTSRRDYSDGEYIPSSQSPDPAGIARGERIKPQLHDWVPHNSDDIPSVIPPALRKALDTLNSAEKAAQGNIVYHAQLAEDDEPSELRWALKCSICDKYFIAQYHGSPDIRHFKAHVAGRRHARIERERAKPSRANNAFVAITPPASSRRPGRPRGRSSSPAPRAGSSRARLASASPPPRGRRAAGDAVARFCDKFGLNADDASLLRAVGLDEAKIRVFGDVSSETLDALLNGLKEEGMSVAGRALVKYGLQTGNARESFLHPSYNFNPTKIPVPSRPAPPARPGALGLLQAPAMTDAVKRAGQKGVKRIVGALNEEGMETAGIILVSIGLDQ
ncbi:uncharacterized protein BXZ73DRAFT_79583 [Epithele typhae]|uniref:uncharacterized protein n=1 Tax=Epithele typhae TaxID=378194 RepID=UPI0020078653|nr:uncharacterized protein BXZ73DRAFT_79583 [Epithele typhae]KAH9923175.1 hypothetical protein BXZ73DRAFT_79583 [Epithele typhae]